MDQPQLPSLLAAGPSRRLDVLGISRRLKATGRGAELMFRTGFLNRCILFKHVERRRHTAETTSVFARPAAVHMLLYFPFDPDHPQAGGEAVPYRHNGFRRLVAAKTGTTEPSPDVLRDESLLDRLDALPALNPFLLRDLPRHDDACVPEAYLELDPQLLQRLTRRLERRVRPLIVAAFAADPDCPRVHEAVPAMVQAFMDPNKRQHLRGLAAALHIEPDVAVDVLGAWAGIAFFENEVADLKEAVRRFAEWLAQVQVPDAALARRLDGLRVATRETWRELREIFAHYQTSYDALVFDRDPRGFVEFLASSRRHYLRLGALCTRLELAVHTRGIKSDASSTTTLAPDLLADVITALERVFDIVDPTPPQDPPAGQRLKTLTL